jgi:hypothetical protein
LDFFLITNNIIPLVSDCTIKNSVQSRLFDHKAIFLEFTSKKSLSSRPNISNKILRDRDLDIVVEIACLDCYCTNLEGNEVLRNTGNRLIGRAHVLLREAGPDPSYLPYAHARLKDVDERIVLMASLTTTMEDLRNLNLTLQQINIDGASFMEILINGIRNDVISYQAFVFKTLASSRKNLEDKIVN